MAEISRGDSDGDPLGKPYAVYDARNRAVAYLVIGVVALVVGVAGLIYGLPRGDDGLMATLIGGLFAAAAPVFIGVAGYNLRRGFEVRRKGVRYRSWGGTVELLWGDIKRIDVTKLVDSAAAEAPDARLGMHGSHSRWEVEITGRKKVKIVLGYNFTALVKSPSTLVNLLKMHSKLDIDDSAISSRRG